MKVCEKVEQKVRTTYNESDGVCDVWLYMICLLPLGVFWWLGHGSDRDGWLHAAAVAAAEMIAPSDMAYDEKNIRRRVYDALNVLMAMDIITKEKKNIMWRGLPTNTEQESARLQELVAQQISFKNLIQRNSARDKRELDRVALPFIV
ncbi:MAG: hypothetical protein SGPRY_014774, partial [Prymnesium sp.]